MKSTWYNQRKIAGIMDYSIQFKRLIASIAWKNLSVLPDLSQREIEMECWIAAAIAIRSWDGAKGKLSSWIYTAVTGRMKDLRKKHFRQRPVLLGNCDVPDTGCEMTEEFMGEMNDALGSIDNLAICDLVRFSLN